jgi:hypothetical protein
VSVDELIAALQKLSDEGHGGDEIVRATPPPRSPYPSKGVWAWSKPVVVL